MMIFIFKYSKNNDFLGYCLFLSRTNAVSAIFNVSCFVLNFPDYIRYNLLILY